MLSSKGSVKVLEIYADFTSCTFLNGSERTCFQPRSFSSDNNAHISVVLISGKLRIKENLRA